jgi:hypothetical protein
MNLKTPILNLRGGFFIRLYKGKEVSRGKTFRTYTWRLAWRMVLGGSHQEALFTNPSVVVDGLLQALK